MVISNLVYVSVTFQGFEYTPLHMRYPNYNFPLKNKSFRNNLQTILTRHRAQVRVLGTGGCKFSLHFTPILSDYVDHVLGTERTFLSGAGTGWGGRLIVFLEGRTLVLEGKRNMPDSL